MFTRVASYKGMVVAVKILKKRHLEVTRRVRKELQIMKEMSHDNINRFVGACVDQPNVWIVTHYCARGSLKVSVLCTAADTGGDVCCGSPHAVWLNLMPLVSHPQNSFLV